MAFIIVLMHKAKEAYTLKSGMAISMHIAALFKMSA